MHALERRKIDTGMLTVSATLLGGLGLFLLAVGMITDGLKLAAGDTLRDVLARSTSTPLRGVASGILVTALVQSSSAVTVATIGFVNAGLLTLPQSLGVVYGANIGTTMTGWLVASVGFGVKLETFALPLVGLGMLGRLVRPASRIGSPGSSPGTQRQAARCSCMSAPTAFAMSPTVTSGSAWQSGSRQTATTRLCSMAICFARPTAGVLRTCARSPRRRTCRREAERRSMPRAFCATARIFWTTACRYRGR